MKKIVSLLCVISLCACSAFADVRVFDNFGGAGDGLWSNGNNWNSPFSTPTRGTVPGSGDESRYVGANGVGTIEAGTDALTGILTIGWYGGGTPDLTMNGGTLTCDDATGQGLRIGYGGGTGSLTVNDGIVEAKNIGVGWNGWGTLNVNGGEIRGLAGGASGLFRLGVVAGRKGILNMTGGTITAPDFRIQTGPGDLNLSGGLFDVDQIFFGFIDGTAEIMMSGGTIEATNSVLGAYSASAYANVVMTDGQWNSSGVLHVGRDGGTAHFQLDGGTVTCGHFALGIAAWTETVGTGTMDITDGTLIVDNTSPDVDLETLFASYETSGILTAFGGDGELVFDYDPTGDIMTVTAIPEPATLTLIGLGGLLLRKRKA